MMMKKRILLPILIASAVLMSWQLSTSSFSVVGDSIVRLSINKNEKLELAEIKIANNTDGQLELKWSCLVNTLPSGWDYSMCAYGKCQVGIPEFGTLRSIGPGKTGFVAIHVLPKGIPGNGRVKFKLIDPINNANSEIVEFRVSANGSTGKK